MRINPQNRFFRFALSSGIRQCYTHLSQINLKAYKVEPLGYVLPCLKAFFGCAATAGVWHEPRHSFRSLTLSDVLALGSPHGYSFSARRTMRRVLSIPILCCFCNRARKTVLIASNPHAAVIFENLGEKPFYIAELWISSTLQIPLSKGYFEKCR